MLPSLTRLFTQSFVAPPAAESRTIAAFGLNNVRMLQNGNDLVGALVHIPMGQWYGGQKVSMTGIGSVTIAVHHRGQGQGRVLLERSLRELQEEGIALSVLYPATQGLYRQWGYEVAGSWVLWRLDCDLLPRWKPSLAIEPIPLTVEALQPLYDRYAELNTGHLDRHPGIWELHFKGADAYAYRFGSPENPQGYVVYHQDRTDSGTRLQVKDWGVFTPAALQCSWAFFAQHQLQLDELYWQGSRVDPRLMILPEQAAKIHLQRSWMLRILNLEAALTQRGYPRHLETELHLQVTDPLFPVNSDRFCLQVSHGQAQVQRGGSGALSLTIAAMAPLFSGFLTPQQLQHLGYLTGDDRTLTIAHQLFTGANPWMLDFF